MNILKKKRFMFLFGLVIFILTFGNIRAQISIYEEKSNSAAEIMNLLTGMTYNEFLKIQRQIDWSKIIIASIVPGFIHFYADKKTEGWILLGIRVIGYGLVGYASLNQYKLINDDRFSINVTDKRNRQNQNVIIFGVGSLLNIFGFFYDWAAGSLSIEKERNEIYFKYGIEKTQKLKVGFLIDNYDNHPYLNISLQL